MVKKTTRDEHIQAIRHFLSEIKLPDFGTLEEEFAVSGKRLRESCEEVLRVIQTMHDLSIDRLRGRSLWQLADSLKSIRNVFHAMREIKTEKRQDIFLTRIDELDEHLDDLKFELERCQLNEFSVACDADSLLKRQKNAVANVTELESELASIQTRADSINRSLGFISAKTAENSIASSFKWQAFWDRLGGIVWFTAMIFCIACVINLSVAYYEDPIIPREDRYKSDISTLYVASTASYRFLTVSLLVFAAVVCGRMLRAQLHNLAINKHRLNTLLTFRLFVESETDPEIRKVITIHAANAAFSPRPTGFEPSGKDTATPPAGTDVIIKTIGEGLKQ